MSDNKPVPGQTAGESILPFNDHNQSVIRDIEAMTRSHEHGWWSKALAISALRIIKTLAAEIAALSNAKVSTPQELSPLPPHAVQLFAGICDDKPASYYTADQMLAFRSEGIAAALAHTAPAQATNADEAFDNDSVDQFAAHMKAKLNKKRLEGRHGWHDRAACSREDLSRMLLAHISKGDPVDVANFAMMLWCRCERIVLEGAAPVAPGKEPDAWKKLQSLKCPFAPGTGEQNGWEQAIINAMRIVLAAPVNPVREQIQGEPK